MVKPSAYPLKFALSGGSSGSGSLMGIGVTIVVSSRAVAGENSRDPLASIPPDNCTRSHFAMSSADELMPPAGFVLSLTNGAIGRTLPSTRACVVATLPPAAADEWRTFDPVIPTFARIRDEMKSSQL